MVKLNSSVEYVKFVLSLPHCFVSPGIDSLGSNSMCSALLLSRRHGKPFSSEAELRLCKTRERRS